MQEALWGLAQSTMCSMRLSFFRHCMLGSFLVMNDALFDFDKNLAVRDDHVVAAYVFTSDGGLFYAGGELEYGPVPRAGDAACIHGAFRKWAALVRAGVVDGIEGSIGVKDGDAPPADIIGTGFAGWDFANG